MSGFHVVIPARIGSSRLPGKPLLMIDGVSMIIRVARQAAGSGALSVIVATDDKGIHRAVTGAGYRAVMTRADHVSGSDRVQEVAHGEGWPDETIVINVQGDEPLLPPVVVRQLAVALAADPAVDAATLCEPVDDVRIAEDPNSVKVVRDAQNNALYFSRSPIPAFGVDEGHGTAGPWLRHVGIYGYRAGVLHRFVALAPGVLERAESLEQLRLLENGMRLLVLDSCCRVPRGVDTPEDLERVRNVLAGESARDSSPHRGGRFPRTGGDSR